MSFTVRFTPAAAKDAKAAVRFICGEGCESGQTRLPVQYSNMIGWISGEFDHEAFELAERNQAL